MFTSKQNVNLKQRKISFVKLTENFKMLIFSAGKDGLKQTFKNMNCNLTISIKSLKNLSDPAKPL